MLFNSLEFLVFFPVIFFAYFALAHKFRWALLLVASYIFYAYWHPVYLGLLIVSTVVDYLAGLGIASSSRKVIRRLFLALSLSVNLGLLFSFKYIDFFIANLNTVFAVFPFDYQLGFINILLPIGISFYTFQTLSYTLDIFRGKLKPERHLGRFALFVSFFPQLVAGPVERAKDLLPQFKLNHSFDYSRAVLGLRRMLWGFFQKIVIADRLALYVDSVYAAPETHAGLPIIMAALFFTLQVYCDFAGYSNIAIGTAQMMGFNLRENFRRPFFATSITQFWQRWHISVSTWFRDYLYLPLAKKRQLKALRRFDLLLTFLVIGLWHGASWTYALFGLLSGIFIILEQVLRPYVKLHSPAVRNERPVLGIIPQPSFIPLARIYVFLLITITGIFFRSQTLQQAGVMFENAFALAGSSLVIPGFSKFPFCIACLSIFLLFFVEMLEERSKQSVYSLIGSLPKWLRWLLYTCMVFSIVLFGNFGSQEFIYFQF